MPPVAYASYELQNFPDVAATNFTGKINETLVDWKAREEVRAYQAGVSYTDSNIGAVLDELKAVGHWKDTIVLFWGDHGWKLGQHGAWAKHTNFFCDTNTPLMLRVPGITDGGMLSHALVEHVDIMATLVEAAGLPPVPTCPEHEPWKISRCTEGQSFLPLLSSKSNRMHWKNASYSQYPRINVKDSRGVPVPQIMGYSMNTDKGMRFTAWVEFDGVKNQTNWNMHNCSFHYNKMDNCGVELYDHNSDPDENRNLAYLEDYKESVAQMLQQLKAGWRSTASALPMPAPPSPPSPSSCGRSCKSAEDCNGTCAVCDQGFCEPAE
jgi:iduronate 2-sulfatase